MTKQSLKNAWTIAKLNFINLKIAYFVPLGIFLFILMLSTLNVIVGLEFMTESVVLYSNFAILLVVILSVFLINFRNNSRMIRLNAKKLDLFFGIAINYLIMIVLASILIIEIYYLSMPLRIKYGGQLLGGAFSGYFDIYYVLGFSKHNVGIGFLQLFSFLLLACSGLHLLLGLQEKWYGQVVLAIIGVIIFLLRFVWYTQYVELLINANRMHIAWIITIKMVLGVGLFMSYLLVLRKKRVS